MKHDDRHLKDFRESFDVSDVVSERSSTSERVTNEEENDARLRGLMAMLALPPRRGVDGRERRVSVEVEIATDTWTVVDSVYIEADKITVCRDGVACFAFLRSEGVPRWRTPDIAGSNAPLVIP